MTARASLTASKPAPVDVPSQAAAGADLEAARRFLMSRIIDFVLRRRHLDVDRILAWTR